MTEDTVRIRLPEASPELYLRWMAYWRRVEERMAGNPFLERLIADASAPFFDDEIAEFISRDLVTAIERQAEEAQQAGEPSVAPTLKGQAETLSEAVAYVIRRSRLLQRPDIARDIKIRPLPEELANLRAMVMAVIQMQLSETGIPPRPRLEPPSMKPAGVD
jgi:hypothetical protein